MLAGRAAVTRPVASCAQAGHLIHDDAALGEPHDAHRRPGSPLAAWHPEGAQQRPRLQAGLRDMDARAGASLHSGLQTSLQEEAPAEQGALALTAGAHLQSSSSVAQWLAGASRCRQEVVIAGRTRLQPGGSYTATCTNLSKVQNAGPTGPCARQDGEAFGAGQLTQAVKVNIWVRG